MDKQGNIVAVTKTVNYVFGSGIVPEGYGFIMNDEMDDFDAEVGTANEVQPGKRPMSSMSPTIILKDGKPVMTIGAPGSQRIISGVAQVISNVIDFDMDIQDAISAPRIHAGSDWTTSDETIMIETRIDKNVIEGLKAMGHPVLETGDWMDYRPGPPGRKPGAERGAGRLSCEPGAVICPRTFRIKTAGTTLEIMRSDSRCNGVSQIGSHLG